MFVMFVGPWRKLSEIGSQKILFPTYPDLADVGDMDLDFENFQFRYVLFQISVYPGSELSKIWSGPGLVRAWSGPGQA